MTTQRFNRVFALARAAKQSLDRYGSIRRNKLPLVSFLEHDWLTKHHKAMAGFVRTFQYSDSEYIEDTSRPVQARPPKITEIWVGSRSLGCVPGESAETETEGLSASQLEQEDAAELTDLQTLLYHDPVSGHSLIEDPDDGHLRPIRNGDVVSVVRGSNDDLDALFLEEGDDPRVQNDLGAVGTDHKWSDRFRANTDLEQSFLDSREYKLPNSAADDTRWCPDDLTMRRLAQNLVAKVLERRPDWEDNILALTDEAEQRIRAMSENVKFNQDGAMIAGYFMTRDEFFGTLESNLRELERVHERHIIVKKQFTGEERPRSFRRSKELPTPTDWDAIRSPAQKRARAKLVG